MNKIAPSHTLSCAALAAALLLASSAASADAADDARAHFQAIASGDVPALMQSYANGAQFQWVGGMLDGVYATPESIRGVWAKFAAAQGPLKLSVEGLEASSNPKGSTVVARVMFEGKAAIKVRYALTYRDGKIVTEVWQLDPQLDVKSAY